MYVFPSAFPESCLPGGCLSCPGVTFLHEGVAYDTSSGLGQTSPNSTSNTPAWSLPSPVVPFCIPTPTPTTTTPSFLPPLNIVAVPPQSPLHVSLPEQQLGSTCSWLALLFRLALPGCCSWVTGYCSQLLWPETGLTHKKRPFWSYVWIERWNCLYDAL